jgi:hypothetical protein
MECAYGTVNDVVRESDELGQVMRGDRDVRYGTSGVD